MFCNKVALVTGASCGIGKAAALYFAKNGANVVLTDRQVDKLQAVTKQCQAISAKHFAVPGDLVKFSDMKCIVESAVKRFGKIDILVNNAGLLGKGQSVMEPNLVCVHDEVMTCNFRSVVVMTNLAACYLIKSKGSIVNISSIAGIRGLPKYAIYSVSKAAIRSFTECCALEFAPFGVRVNSVAPGPVYTEIFKGHEAISAEQLKTRTSLNSVTKPEEIAEVIGFLANEKNMSITGSNYVIDCGLLVNSK